MRQRKQVGQPLAAFEVIMFESVDSWMTLEADKILTYKAASLADRIYKDGDKFVTQLDLAEYSALAKYRSPHDALDIITRAMTWPGAFDYIKECPLEAAYRGVRSYTVGAEGGAMIQKIVMGREIIGKEYLPYRQKGQFD